MFFSFLQSHHEDGDIARHVVDCEINDPVLEGFSLFQKMFVIAGSSRILGNG
jgi:hypothetical protein